MRTQSRPRVMTGRGRFGQGEMTSDRGAEDFAGCRSRRAAARLPGQELITEGR